MSIVKDCPEKDRAESVKDPAAPTIMARFDFPAPNAPDVSRDIVMFELMTEIDAPEVLKPSDVFKKTIVAPTITTLQRLTCKESLEKLPSSRNAELIHADLMLRIGTSTLIASESKGPGEVSTLYVVRNTHPLPAPLCVKTALEPVT